MPQRRSTLATVATVAVLTLVGACGGTEPTGPGTDGDGGPGGSTRVVKEDPAFAQDIFEVFTRRGCTASGCHGSGQGGLTMTSAANAHANLVGRPSAGAPGETLVISGNAAASYLIKKLTGASGIVGAQMPLGGAPLDTIDMNNIRNWINQGAKNN